MKLLPCPNCKTEGSDDPKTTDLWITKHGSDPWWHIYCDTCGMRGPLGNDDVDAADEWNKLPRNTQSTDIIEKLQRSVELQKRISEAKRCDMVNATSENITLAEKLVLKTQKVDALHQAFIKSGIPFQARHDPEKAPPLRISVKTARSIMKLLMGYDFGI